MKDTYDDDNIYYIVLHELMCSVGCMIKECYLNVVASEPLYACIDDLYIV